MPAPLIEFPVDDPDRALRFWHGVLGVALSPRPVAAGSGWQADIHPGSQWAVCRDSEGSPFALAAASAIAE